MPTNSLAIVSLVAGCAQFFFPVFATITAIVTGHIARSQIRRTGERGAGLALAGLILGYLGVAFALLVIAGVTVFAVGFSGDVAQHNARNQAANFGRAIQLEAVESGSSPRDPNVILRAYVRERDCCYDANVTLADGTSVLDATRADWERVGWRIDEQATAFKTRHACLTVPESAAGPVQVADGPCSSQTGAASARTSPIQAPRRSSSASRAATARGTAAS
jgi:uncharacterized protein DUF4190